MLWDPFGALADRASKVVVDGWTAMMLSLWQAGLWLLRVVLKFESALLTPDVTEQGPAQLAYRSTFWMAGALAVLMGLVQLFVVLARRDGKSLGRLVVGAGQFCMVWVAWLSYGALVVSACGGLNQALMKSLLSIDAWEAWQPLKPLSGQDVSDAVLATVLGLMGLFLWIAAIAHFVILLARAGGLLVLAATAPISAAGLLSEVGRPWFWKSLRWFHAAALAPVLMTLTMGLGVQMSNGVALGLATGPESAIGTAVPGVFMILVSAVAPVALFKLLAFVDPGTNSGAAVRAGLAGVGGISGLLSGLGSGLGGKASGTSASETDEHGRSAGEQASQAATAARFQNATPSTNSAPAGRPSAAAAGGGTASAGGSAAEGGAAAGVLGVAAAIGAAAATGLRTMAHLGGAGSALFSDATNQLGVGHNTYQPDFTRTPGQGSGGAPQGLAEADADAANGNDGTLPTPSSAPPTLDEPTVQPLPPQHPMPPPAPHQGAGQRPAPQRPGTAPTPGQHGPKPGVTDEGGRS
ncbi:hypothetical protein GCM10027030_27370 [Luteococcus sediminum]